MMPTSHRLSALAAALLVTAYSFAAIVAVPSAQASVVILAPTLA